MDEQKEVDAAPVHRVVRRFGSVRREAMAFGIGMMVPVYLLSSHAHEAGPTIASAALIVVGVAGLVSGRIT